MSLFKQRAEALRSQMHTQGSVAVNTPAQKEAFRARKQQYVQQICDEIRDLMMKEIEKDNLRCDTKRPQGFFSAFSTTSKSYNHHYICMWRCRGRLDLSQSIFEYKKTEYIDPYSDLKEITNTLISNDIDLIMECLLEAQEILKEDGIYPVKRILLNGTWAHGNYKMEPTSILNMEEIQKARSMIEAYKKDQSTQLKDFALGGQFAYFVKKK